MNSSIISTDGLDCIRATILREIWKTMKHYKKHLLSIPFAHSTSHEISDDILNPLAPILARQIGEIREHDCIVRKIQEDKSLHACKEQHMPSSIKRDLQYYPFNKLDNALETKSKCKAVTCDSKPKLAACLPSDGYKALLLVHRVNYSKKLCKQTIVTILEEELKLPFGFMNMHVFNPSMHGYIIIVDHSTVPLLKCIYASIFPGYQLCENHCLAVSASPSTARLYYRTFTTHTKHSVDPSELDLTTQRRILMTAAFQRFVPPITHPSTLLELRPLSRLCVDKTQHRLETAKKQ